MGRILRVLLYIILFLAIFFWFFSIVESCNAKKQALSNPEETENGITAVEEGVDDIISEFFEEEDAPSGNNQNDESEEFEAGEKTEEVAKAEKQENTGSSTTTTSAPTTPTSTISTSNEGKYFVVAGSFLVQSNAEKMAQKLKDMGYNQASVVVFDQSQYHTVSALRSKNIGEARQAANELKNKGIDCYVHTRQD